MLPSIDTLWTNTQAAQAGARTRDLTRSDIEWFHAAVKRAVAFAKRHGLTEAAIEVEVNGGGVPNGYKYRAESTTLRLRGGQITVGRERARSGPYGNTKTAIVRVKMQKPKDRTLHSVERWHGGYAYL